MKICPSQLRIEGIKKESVELLVYLVGGSGKPKYK